MTGLRRVGQTVAVRLVVVGVAQLVERHDRRGGRKGAQRFGQLRQLGICIAREVELF